LFFLDAFSADAIDVAVGGSGVMTMRVSALTAAQTRTATFRATLGETRAEISVQVVIMAIDVTLLSTAVLPGSHLSLCASR